MDDLSLVQRVTVWALPVIFAITVHELAHGWTARYFGDQTADQQGRLTLNPIKHFDPVGSLLVPLLMLLLKVGFLFGWAKPVPVAFQNLRHPKRDMVWVAAAGPISNLLMTLAWSLILKLGIALKGGDSSMADFLIFSGVAGIFINLILMVLNMLPLLPLDGGRVLAGLLPDWLAWQYSKSEPWGLPIIVVLLATGVLGFLFLPLLTWLQDFFSGLAGLRPYEFSRILSILFGRG